MLSLIVFCTLVSVAVVQAFQAWKLFRVLYTWRHTAGSPSTLPKVAVVLCLRGDDPFLRDCVTALLDQDYPDFELKVVVDSRDDPAWPIVENLASGSTPGVLQVEPLARRLRTCSLKNSSLIQAVSNLDESIECVALIDADTVPHRTWLREIVAPLADPRVGVSTGHRWYAPKVPLWGAVVRYVWNVGAVGQLVWNRYAWGGSVAIRRSLLPPLAERWRRAISSDVPIYKVARRFGYNVEFAPSIMMINREVCDLPRFYTWMQRQLFVGRLYHPRWPAVAAVSLLSTISLLLACGLMLSAAFTGFSADVCWAAGGWFFYQLTMLALMMMMDRGVRRIWQLRGEDPGRVTLAFVLKCLVAVPLTQFVYATALLTTGMMRTVEWRGVRYRIKHRWNVRLLKYSAFSKTATANVLESI